MSECYPALNTNRRTSLDDLVDWAEVERQRRDDRLLDELVELMEEASRRPRDRHEADGDY